MPNRLINETSPYLLQHAHNPVEWYPWGEDALERSRSEDKPILLSIGYSACHWCHVMERESFENETIAGLMNENFINIKVDREERPDLDAIYMEAVQMLTGSGGWPMTVFLTPEGKPSMAGLTFLPWTGKTCRAFPGCCWPSPRPTTPTRERSNGLRASLPIKWAVAAKYRAERPSWTVDVLHRAYSTLATNFDYQNGGFGMAPKFPQPMTPEFLLRYHDHGYNPRALELVELTLEKMAYGGIYDQVGGAFTVTRLTPTGWSHTSKRCCTTTPCWPACISTLSRSPGSPCTGASPKRPWTTCCGR